MPREYSKILDITSTLEKKWTVLVQVVEYGHTQMSKAKTRFRRLLFTDSQGTKVSAVIFSDNIQFYENTFKQYNRYYISNAKLLETNPRFVVGPYQHSWMLNKQTLVEPHHDQVPPPLPCQFSFTPIDQLYKYAETENYQNIKGVVIKCFPSQSVNQGSEHSSKRDVIIVNEEKKLVMLTMWDSINDNEGHTLEQICESAPIIFAMRVKVTTFYGISLTTRMGSSILINPPVMENLQLQNWQNTNKTELLGLLKNESYKDVDILLTYPEENEIVPIARALVTMKQGKPTWVKGFISLPLQERSLTQTSCANCFKPIEADVSWIITCPMCKQESKVQIMSRATFQIEDETGSICGTISTPHIEKFIQLSPSEVRNAEIIISNLFSINIITMLIHSYPLLFLSITKAILKQGKIVHEIISESIQSSSAVAFVRSYETWHQQRPKTRFVVINAHKYQEHTQIQEKNLPPDQIANLSVIKPPSPTRKHKRDQPPHNNPESSSVASQRATKRMK